VLADAHPTAVRYSLGGLLAFGALNALGGGYCGLTGAVGVPTEWLEGSPFADYFVPSLILLAVVGGSFIVAAIAVFARLRAARFAVFMAAFVVLGWLIVQIRIIGYVSWMQPATAIAGLLILILGSQLLAAHESLDRRRRPLGQSQRPSPEASPTTNDPFVGGLEIAGRFGGRRTPRTTPPGWPVQPLCEGVRDPVTKLANRSSHENSRVSGLTFRVEN
jgi:hypothetical protein